MQPFHIGSLSSGPSTGSLPHGAGSDGARTGTLLGENVALATGTVSLSDTAEELSLHMAEKAESKHHSERKLKSDKPPALLAVPEIIETLEQAKNADAQPKLQELCRALMAGHGSPRQLAGQAFQDITHQYLGLQYALQQGEQDGADPALLEEIRDALADLEMESGPQIRAGLNTLASASGFAVNAEEVGRFQNTYRDMVFAETSLAGTLKLALERFGSNNIGRTIAHLISALGQDLAATRPSAEPDRLQALVADLYHLEVAATVLDGSAGLAQKLAQTWNIAVDAPRLTQDIVAISGEKWASGTRFTAMIDQQGVEDPQARVAFQAGVRQIMKELPVQIFASLDARDVILNAAQDALDTAIDEEDA